MRLLNKHRATLQRIDSEGTWDEKGEYLAPEPTEQVIPCFVQPPFTGSQYQKKLPEGIIAKDCIEINTKFPLRLGNEKDQVLADVIIWKEREYEVFEIEEWFAPSERNDYTKAILVRKDRLHAPT